MGEHDILKVIGLATTAQRSSIVKPDRSQFIIAQIVQDLYLSLLRVK